MTGASPAHCGAWAFRLRAFCRVKESRTSASLGAASRPRVKLAVDNVGKKRSQKQNSWVPFSLVLGHGLCQAGEAKGGAECSGSLEPMR